MLLDGEKSGGRLYFMWSTRLPKDVAYLQFFVLINSLLTEEFGIESVDGVKLDR